MWPGWSRRDLGKAAGCDLAFTEAIHKRMQVPDRLEVASGEDSSSSSGDPGKQPRELVLPPSFRMHIPDRLLLAEMTDAASRPFWEKRLPRQPCPLASDPLLEPSAQSTVVGEQPFPRLASKSGSQKRKRPVHLGRAQKERPLAETPLLTSSGQRQEWLESSFPLAPTRQPPSFLLEGRIYTLQNVLQALHFLGLQLFQLLWEPGGAQLSSVSAKGDPLAPWSPQEERLANAESVAGRTAVGGTPFALSRALFPAEAPAPPGEAPHRELSPALEGPLEQLGATEILAMRKQLVKISGRLRRLEEQRPGWRQKELLLYSLLMSACLLNMWLWLRR